MLVQIKYEPFPISVPGRSTKYIRRHDDNKCLVSLKDSTNYLDHLTCYCDRYDNNAYFKVPVSHELVKYMCPKEVEQMKRYPSPSYYEEIDNKDLFSYRLSYQNYMIKVREAIK